MFKQKDSIVVESLDTKEKTNGSKKTSLRMIDFEEFRQIGMHMFQTTKHMLEMIPAVILYFSSSGDLIETNNSDLNNCIGEAKDKDIIGFDLQKVRETILTAELNNSYFQGEYLIYISKQYRKINGIDLLSCVMILDLNEIKSFLNS